MFIFFPKETFVHVTRGFIFVVRVRNFGQIGKVGTCIVINKQFWIIKKQNIFWLSFWLLA
jgi:hypothetical protein